VAVGLLSASRMNEAHPAATRSIGSANFSRRGCDRSLVGDGCLQGRKVFEIPIKRGFCHARLLHEVVSFLAIAEEPERVPFETPYGGVSDCVLGSTARDFSGSNPSRSTRKSAQTDVTSQGQK
jgi:hypothetical protein